MLYNHIQESPSLSQPQLTTTDKTNLDLYSWRSLTLTWMWVVLEFFVPRIYLSPLFLVLRMICCTGCPKKHALLTLEANITGYKVPETWFSQWCQNGIGLFLCSNESWEHIVFKTGPSFPNMCSKTRDIGLQSQKTPCTLLATLQGRYWHPSRCVMEGWGNYRDQVNI